MGAERATANSAPVVRSGSVAAWAVAVRPRSLFVAISPVLVGATLGFERTGAIDLLATLLVLGAALLMQVITNMQNDVGYTVRGGESSGTRTGLPRATANGWLSVRHVRAGILLASLLAVGFGLALVAYRGWPVLAMEPTCIGKGDPHCGWKVQPPDLWGEEGRPMIEALSVFWASR